MSSPVAAGVVTDQTFAMLLFSPKTSSQLATRVADALGVALSLSEEREFDGGEHKMRPLVDVLNQDVFVVQSLCGEPHASANDKLCRLLFFVGALKDAGAGRVTAVTPYLAYARKDRRTQPRDPVTTRYIAALMEAVKIDRVVTVEIHNEAAFDNSFRGHSIRLEAADVFAGELIKEVADRPFVVMSPDIGGVKRAQRLRERLALQSSREVDFAFMEKRRVRGSVYGETVVGDVAGRVAIIYDDMIASGGTILRASRAAREAGATAVYVAAAHAAFLPSAIELFDSRAADRILVTDSIPLRVEFTPWLGAVLQVCSIAPLVARTLRDLSKPDH